MQLQASLLAATLNGKGRGVLISQETERQN